MNLTTKNIAGRIETEFAQVYRNAAPFVNSGDLWNFCMGVLSNPQSVSSMIFANDLGIPPVRSLLKFYEYKYDSVNDFGFTHQESQWLGSLMGFLFKNIFGYREQKDRVRVDKFNVRTAARFLDGPNDLTIS